MAAKKKQAAKKKASARANRAPAKKAPAKKSARPANRQKSKSNARPAVVARVPAGFHRVTAHLVIRDAAAAIDFYKKAFGAVEKGRHHGPDGKIIHAHIQIGDSPVFLNDEFPEMGALSPLGLNGTPITLHLYVQDADKQFQQAIGAGAEVVMPLADQFWGDRYGMVKDPFGHQWSIGSHIEDVTEEELARRSQEAMAQMCQPAEQQPG